MVTLCVHTFTYQKVWNFVFACCCLSLLSCSITSIHHGVIEGFPHFQCVRHNLHVLLGLTTQIRSESSPK